MQGQNIPLLNKRPIPPKPTHAIESLYFDRLLSREGDESYYHAKVGSRVYVEGMGDSRPCLAFPESNVKQIRDHAPQGPGDAWFYDIHFEDGVAIRVYNVMRVVFTPVASEKSEFN